MTRRTLAFLPLVGVLLTQPFVGSGFLDREHDDDEAQNAQGALEWRQMTLRGPDGRIPADGLAKAREHIRSMRVERSTPSSSAAPQGSAAALSRANWRWLGPGNIAGRVRAIAISPANPDTMFAGGVDGGVWRSDDAGDSWRVVDDFMANLAVTAIEINPQNPNEMYAGTGEVYNNYDALHGGGIFKSSDGGVTWSLLPGTSPSFESAFFQGVGRLAMSPDGSVLIAAAGGYFFRSTNGGAGFSRSNRMGPIDVDFDPTSSTKAVGVGYSGAGWYTRDGGVTWQTSSGVPTTPPPGRLEVAYARSQPDLVYLATMDGKLYVSTNGGVSYTPRFSGLNFAQGWYNLALWVNPRDSNHILLGAESLYESTDGGFSFRALSISASLHTDQHVIVERPGFDNATNRSVFIGNDGGIYRVEVNPGGTYGVARRSDNLGITQFYGGAGSPDGQIIGGTQDNGTVLYRPAAGTAWSPMLGADGGFCAWDQSNPNLMYMETQYLRLYRSVGGSDPIDITNGISDSGSNNSNFIAPFILDPNNQGTMLAGGRSLWRSTNVNDTAHFPTWSNIKSGSTESPITAIAVAQGASDVIWVGHTGGNVYKTLNGTAAAPSWTRMFNTLGGTFVTRVTIDPTNFNTVYVSIGGFSKPNIVRSDDGGVSWVDATGSGTTALPTAPVRDVEVDPFDVATIYAATEVGLFTSHDRGATWALPQDGPANVSVDELFFTGSTLVAATHGRGMFAQDLNPQGTQSLSIAPDHLDFGTWTTNTPTASQHVTVTNTGTGPVTIQSIQVDAGDTDSFYISASSCFNAGALPPGGTCGFDAVFIPRSEGPLSAVVDVSSTAPGSPNQMTLSGIGQAPSNALPAPWTHQDIGAVGVAGSATYANATGTFSIKGSGIDIWDTDDQFHYVYQPLDGNGTIVARVASVQNVHAWTKAGLMVRASTDPESAHASVFVTPGKGIALQWRSTAGNPTTNFAVAGAAPKWVRLVRSGNSVTASYSSDGTAWTSLDTVTVTLPQQVLVGMPVTSHDNTQTATAAIDNVSVTAAPIGLPAPWTQQDIGAVGVAGSGMLANGTFTIKGSGADIWGTADAFHYVYQPLNGNGSVVARVASVQNVYPWTKAGIMIRATTDPGSAHASVFVTPGKGIAFQWRSTTGGTSLSFTDGSAGSAPKWVKLERFGNSVSASYSSDGVGWTSLDTVSVTLPQNVLVGLPISSHDNTQLATATIDNVSVTTTSLPAPWTQQDIGSVGVAGAGTDTNGTFTVTGSGTDIWGTADAFHYVYQPLSGDTIIQAHVMSVENVNVWTKAGLMIRASTAANAAHVSVFVTPGKGTAMQWRSSTGGVTSNIQVAGVAPTFIRLTRSGNSFTAWYASDGSTWTAIGSATVTMAPDAFVGLAITSHDNTRTATARIDGVNFSQP